MTDPINLLLQYGIHSSGSDWLTEPSTIDIQLAQNRVFWPSPEYTAIARGGVRPANNENVPGLRGVPNMALGDISLEVEGLSAGGAGNGTEASTLSSTVESAYECVFGTTAGSGEGDTTDGADGGSGTTISMDAATNFVANDWLLAKTTTGAVYQARQVASVSSADVTACRALTTTVGAADTAAESEVAYGGLHYFPDVDAPNHKHLFFQAEHIGGFEGKFYGVHPTSAGWTLAHGDILKFNMGGLSATHWTKESLAGGTYSAPTTGNKIVCAPIYFYVGSSLYMASDISIDLGLEVAPRRSGTADAGSFGMVTTGIKPKISGTFLYGDQTAPNEVTEALMTTWQGAQPYTADTFDILIQAGDQPGACAAWRAENARFMTLERTEVDGLHAVRFTLECTEATGNVGSLVHALF